MKFVTYNYDRVLETFFDAVIENTFNLDRTKASAVRQLAIPIIHLHGQLEAVEFGHFEETTAVDSLPKIATAIRVVHEEVAESDPVYTRARSMMQSAGLICLLGFGYHPTNARRLDLGSFPHEVAGTTYGMGEAEVEQAQSDLGRAFRHYASVYKCVQFLRQQVRLG